MRALCSAQQASPVSHRHAPSRHLNETIRFSYQHRNSICRSWTELRIRLSLRKRKSCTKESWSVSMNLRPGTQPLLLASPSRCTNILCKGSVNFMNDSCWELYYVCSSVWECSVLPKQTGIRRCGVPRFHMILKFLFHFRSYSRMCWKLTISSVDIGVVRILVWKSWCDVLGERLQAIE